MSQPDPATAGLRSTTTEVGSVFVSNYPPFSFWGSESLPRVREQLAAPQAEPQRPIGLYLHIPFCRKRCKFCYFKVYTDKNSDEIGRYVDALAREIELLCDLPAVRGRPLRFVYFGGGTPSYISVKHLIGLVERMQRVMPWQAAQEVTFECEPGTLTQSKLEALRDIGVTRLSLGIENFNDEILRQNGRAHLSEEIYRVLPWIQALRFDQLNVDLIAGMLGETDETWRETVQKTIDAEADSVTVYQMELPHNTRFSKSLMVGDLAVPLADWEKKREWHDYAFQRLAEADYAISSAYTMVKQGREAEFVYRDALWQGSDMLGTGVASFSHLGDCHFQNLSSWSGYLEEVGAGRLPLDRAFVLTPQERLTRELILQLKRGQVQIGYFREKFAVEVVEEFAAALERLEQADMLEVQADRIALTRRGLLQVDALLPEFYDSKYRNARYT